MKDFYEILEVPKDATQSAIKKSFRRLALKYHPDKNPGNKKAEERFKELAVAYETLSDPKRRHDYDGELAGGRSPSADEWMRTEPGREAWSMDEILSRFGDLFRGDFGESIQRERPRGRPGHDVETRLEIDFRTSVSGGKVRVSLSSDVACPVCSGQGAAGSSPECRACGGTGRVTRQSGQPGQFFTLTRPCPSCGGTGIDPQKRCAECRGVGVVGRTRAISISIPEGIEDGTTLRLKGLGGAGIGGAPAGDLLVHVGVRPDPVFHRVGNDLYRDIEVPVARAALGGKVSVATFRGTANLTVPPGTSSGAQLRLRGQGLKGGDLILNVFVTVPKRLTDRERELYEELSRISSGKNT